MTSSDDTARIEAKRRGIVGEGFPAFVEGARWQREQTETADNERVARLMAYAMPLGYSAALARFEAEARSVREQLLSDQAVEAAAWTLYASECRRQGIEPVKRQHESGWSEAAWTELARAALIAALEAIR